AVDGLQVDLDAEVLLRLRQQLLAQELVGRGDEIVPAQPVHGGGLRVRRRAAGGQDAGHAAGLCRYGACTGHLKELAARETSHSASSHVKRLGWDFSPSRRSLLAEPAIN